MIYCGGSCTPGGGGAPPPVRCGEGSAPAPPGGTIPMARRRGSRRGPSIGDARGSLPLPAGISHSRGDPMNDSFQRRNRRSIRLRAYDYTAPGAYFVTVCTQDQAHLFGDVVDGGMWLNDAGRMIIDIWESLSDRFPTIRLDAFVVMPNHIHGIIVIVGAPLVGAQDDRCETVTRAATRAAPTLGDIVGAFKSITTVEYIRGVKQHGWSPFHKRLWQRNYYEHIIRDDRALDAIRRYIVQNPVRWHLDRYNAERVAPDPWAEEIWRMMREPFPGREGEDRG